MTKVSEQIKDRRQRLRAHPAILVVEKDKEVRELILEMLAGQGFDVASAADSAEALNLGRNEDRRIDLLLTETDPSGMRAQDLVRVMYKLRPKMKILFMSGKFDEGFAFMLGDQAERLFLLKPFTRQILLEKINDILH